LIQTALHARSLKYRMYLVARIGTRLAILADGTLLSPIEDIMN